MPLGADNELPDVSVLVVTYRSEALLPACLGSIGPAAPNLRWDLVVVDNDSPDAGADVAEAAGALVVRRPTNDGFAAAVNVGLAHASARWVLLLNPDVVLDAGAIAAMVDVASSDPRLAVVGCALRDPDGSPQPSWAAWPTLLAEVAGRDGRDRTPHPDLPAVWIVDAVGGAVMLLRREAIDAVGPFDERFFMYAEEVDWCRRARDAGWVVGYTTTTSAVHEGGASAPRAGSLQLCRLHTSKVMLRHKYHGRIGGLALIALDVLASMAAIAARTPRAARGGDDGLAARRWIRTRLDLVRLLAHLAMRWDAW